jgi:hypothetical protein
MAEEAYRLCLGGFQDSLGIEFVTKGSRFRLNTVFKGLPLEPVG